jgi:ATP-dependent protease ClpP protease subunit
MKKELYLFAPIYDFVAEAVLSQIEDNMDNDVTLRTLTPGGNLFAAYSIYAKLKEHGNVHLKVDGAANSAGAFLPLYAKSSECLDVSRFVFHRADMFVENAEEQKFLDDVNKDLKRQMKMRIDADKWKEATGITIEQMFDPTTRKDFTLTGVQAKAVGLVTKVVKLTPQMQKELVALNDYYKVAATTEEEENKNPKITTMTKEEFKAKHPEVYAAIATEAVTAERDRVGAWMAFSKADPEAVAKGIKEGKNLSQTEMAELSVKMLSGKTLDTIKDENAEAVKTDEVKDPKNAKAKTDAEKEVAAFEERIDGHLGLKKEVK